MAQNFRPGAGLLADMSLLRIETSGPVVHLRLNRPDKRNALNEALVRELQSAFVNLPQEARAAVIIGEGSHFSAGLDLSEVTEQSVAEGIFRSRKWHAAFDLIRFDPVPVIAVLRGVVVVSEHGCVLKTGAIALTRCARTNAPSRRAAPGRGDFCGDEERSPGVGAQRASSSCLPRLL